MPILKNDDPLLQSKIVNYQFLYLRRQRSIYWNKNVDIKFSAHDAFLR